MLIYHFGTRDGLLREILGQARRRQVEAFTDLIRLRPDEPYRHPGPRLVRDLRAAGRALPPHVRPAARHRGRTTLARLPADRDHRLARTTEEGMRSLGRPELATVVLAVIRGLLKDLDATGDTARTDQSLPRLPRHN